MNPENRSADFNSEGGYLPVILTHVRAHEGFVRKPVEAFGESLCRFEKQRPLCDSYWRPEFAGICVGYIVYLYQL